MRSAILIVLAIVTISSRRQDAASEPFEPGVFTAAGGINLPYRLLRPQVIRSGATYPLVVQLHASGAIGTDNRAQIGPFATGWLLPEIRKSFPAFVLVPQFPARTVEYAEVADPLLMRSKPTPLMTTTLELVERIVTGFPIDRSRIYVVGFSMGASTALQAIVARPELFAAVMAIAPVPPETAPASTTPILVLHGDADTENPYATSRRWSDDLKARGAQLEFRSYPGLQHQLPVDVPNGTWWRKWLFSKRREVHRGPKGL